MKEDTLYFKIYPFDPYREFRLNITDLRVYTLLHHLKY